MLREIPVEKIASNKRKRKQREDNAHVVSMSEISHRPIEQCTASEIEESTRVLAVRNNDDVQTTMLNRISMAAGQRCQCVTFALLCSRCRADDRRRSISSVNFERRQRSTIDRLCITYWVSSSSSCFSDRIKSSVRKPEQSSTKVEPSSMRTTTTDPIFSTCRSMASAVVRVRSRLDE
jgi:hypothetical protein